MTSLQFLLGALSGVAVGFTLGLVGGGGSILAVPLMSIWWVCRTHTWRSEPVHWLSRPTR